MIPLYPKAVFFDWDNTLVDTSMVCFQSINIALEKMGDLPMSWESFLKTPPMAIQHFFANLYVLEKAKDAEKIFYESMFKQHLVGLSPTLGAKSLLRFLNSQKIPMGIVSNKHGQILRKEIQHLGWEKYFLHAVGSYDTPEDKPSPMPLLYALEKQELSAGEHIWFVGDSVLDVQCAIAAQCMPISIGNQEEKHQLPSVKVKNCLDICQLLRSLVKDQKMKINQ